MEYQILATDYDGTLAHHGRVEPATILALERLKASERRAIMVTGRELPELQRVFERLDLFDWVVAENGGLLYRPSTGVEKPLGEAPPLALVDALRAKGVADVSVGRVIVATWEPFEKIVLETIHELGLEWQIIFNKGAVMALPTGINKATGLAAALDAMSMAPEHVVGVGDAENDHAFLKMCGFSAAVANALPAIKETADVTTRGDHGQGVIELIDGMIAGALTRAASVAASQRADA
jgi:HAD superfamily hydrolase (TIGR01484 family)